MFIRFSLLAAALLAGPAMAAPPAGGSISIEVVRAGEAAPPAQAFVEAATEALAAHGFTILEDAGHAAWVAELTVARSEVGTGAARIARGRSSTFGGGGAAIGAGVSIPLASAKTAAVPLQRTQLVLRLHPRGVAAAEWQGTAVTIRPAGTREGADGRVAADLGTALLRGYPAQPDGVLGVP